MLTSGFCYAEKIQTLHGLMSCDVAHKWWCVVLYVNGITYIIMSIVRAPSKPRLHDTTCCQTSLTTRCIV